MNSSSGGGAQGRNPTPASSSASPSSSSSGPTHLGFDPAHQLHQHQHHISLRNQQQQQHQQQQQQQRKPEGEENRQAYKVGGGIHGVVAGSNFSSPSSSIPMSQLKFNELTHQHGAQLREESQSKGQGSEQLQNQVHQAYLQFALQNAQQQKTHGNILMQQAKFGTAGPHARDQDIRASHSKMQDPMSLQAGGQAQVPIFHKGAEHFGHEKPMEQGHTSSHQRNEQKLPAKAIGQPIPTSTVRSMQAGMENATNRQLVMVQFQAWAMERNIDLSLPGNANLIAQLWPIWQSSRLASMQKPNEVSTTTNPSALPPSKQQVMSSPVGSETSAHRSPSSEYPGQASQVKTRQTLPFGSISSARSRDIQNERAVRPPMAMGNGGPVMHLPQSSAGSSQSMEHSNLKDKYTGSEAFQTQYSRQLQQPIRPQSQAGAPSSDSMGTQIPFHGEPVQVQQPRVGFTKKQLHVLKAQILAFRRLKRGEGALPHEVLQAIVPPPLCLEPQQVILPPGTANQEKSVGKTVEEHVKYAATNDNAASFTPRSKAHGLPKEESVDEEEKAAMASHLQGVASSTKELPVASVRNAEESNILAVKAEHEAERDGQRVPIEGDHNINSDKGKTTPVHTATTDAGQVKKPATSSSTSLAKDAYTRRPHAPLFDFPFFTRKPDALGSSATSNSSNLTLAYNVKDLLFEEGVELLKKKRTENLNKISGLLAINLERKRIRPDLVMRLQIEERKLRLLDVQARLRDEVDQQQQEIMEMPDRPYRKFIRQCERQRIELTRQVQQLQKSAREKQLKSIFQWRKKLLESHWAIRDARTTRNRGIAKYHERMLRDFSKRKDDGRNKRMEALKNNDVDRYREMLLEQQTNVPGDSSQRYAVLSSFLSQTEEYLYKLGGKITAAKNHQEVEEAAKSAAAAARSQGLSEEEVKAAAACAGEEVTIRNRFSEMNAPRGSASVNKYYRLAHAVNERVVRQPSMLRAGTLRDYQLVGLQWMLSLYNNKLNGILADEMGLGKTVQVMALIAYLMEFKGNYGPHLIIVPNAVLVNWKSELHNWLPSVSCIFYVGAKEQRARLFSQEVCAMKFNVLVTTYEFVMFDRSKLSKIDWKYIVIDEAQRMKDRESVLARDLDRYRCQRRLLLTGTPLQNDLKELWSLLNLLLPDVFDNKKAFHDWFSKPFQKDGPSHDTEEDDWLETEKKVIIIHRLHQILEPFMLRRRVEDVEGALPRKVSVVLKCRMSAIQGAIYDWIKSTGTIRVDPEDELRRAQKNPNYQVKMYKNLNNKCMELRKACNHPLLNYPYFNDYSKEFLVKSCGKLWILDRILVKLHRAGHRVLLFSTMTKLLDIVEEYLQWRRLVYRRIDGTTSLEDRESAINDFNTPDTDCFIFLLSIRAAGRGLNLQSADTVVIYDPDPNPQNEEQAVARAHRIGQKREVKVIYMEAVVDKISSCQKEDELRTGGGTEELEDDLAGKDCYMGSIESLIRTNIQQYKIDMADEVINAGRFDQRTTHEERRMTLETLLHDDERCQETVHDVPSLQEVNRMIARSEEEIELFDQMDEDFDWTGEMLKHNQVPNWLRAGSRELNSIVAKLSKKPSKNILASSIGLESNDIFSGLSPSKTERRGRLRGPSTDKKYSIYREVDDEDGENSDASSVERNTSSLQEEEGEIGEDEDEDEDFNVVGDVQPSNKDQLGEALIFDGGNYEIGQVMDGSRGVHLFEDAASSGSSSGSRRLRQPATSSMSLQKFGSLSALDAGPNRRSKKSPDELEEGEIAVSGDSHMDIQQSGSWSHDRDDGEDEQVLQPKIKRKRSMRIRPRCAIERLEEKSGNERVPSQCGYQLPMQMDQDYDMQSHIDPEVEPFSEPGPERHDLSASSLRQRHNLPPRRASQSNFQKPGRSSTLSGSAEDAVGHSRENWIGKASIISGTSFPGTKMSDSMHRKCKNVVSKLQRRINKDGYEIIPALYDLWKQNDNSTLPNITVNNPFDLQRIDQRVDNLEYDGVTDFIADVQLMLKNVVNYCNYSYEVKYEARKLNDIFFDIMKIAFPDTDFREARNSLAFPSHGSASSATAATPQKQQKMISKAEPVRVPPKPSPRGSSPLDEEGRLTRASASKLQSRLVTRDQAPPERSLTHPGDLVICKKKRKDRRVGPVSPPSQSRSSAGPSSPRTSRNSRIPAQQKEAVNPPQQSMALPGRWTHQPARQHGSSVVSGGPPSGVVEEAQWAKPVKRMRTDAGKRRPSYS